jgi:hypothetical protein
LLEIDRTAEKTVDAPPERCMQLLEAAVDYPSWASLIETVEVLGEGRVRLRVEIFGRHVVMDCRLSLGPGQALLERLPYEEDDEERYVATWKVAPGDSDGFSEVSLHVLAALEAPGPARVLRGRIERRLADDLLDDFARAASSPPG